MSDSLYPFAALVGTAPDRFELRLRWLLGTERQELPRPNDAFAVQIRLIAADRYLQADGMFGPPRQPYAFRVVPKPFAMIDPPREWMPLPSDPSRSWHVARKPTAPIDPDATTGEEHLRGVGICHILAETQPSRIQARVERLLAAPVNAASRALVRRSGMEAFATQDPADDVRALAAMIVRQGLRPLHLASTLRAQHALLVEATATGRDDAHGLFAFRGATPTQRWQRAALAFEVLSDRKLLQTLDDIVTPPTQLRQQLRLRALQGGTMIDFWCSPERLAPCLEDARGSICAAAELIGCGLHVGNFTAGEIEQWSRDLGATEIAIEVRVEHLRAEALQPVFNADGLILDVLTDADAPFAPGTFPLLALDLQRALSKRSSLPPTQPAAAHINYDLLQTNPGADEDAQLGYVTGDAQVEILIAPGEQTTFNKTVFGFNVYGMWETAATAIYFENPNVTPSLTQLQPYLITRKYSYERDLKGAFADDSRALRVALECPSWQPVLIRPTEVSNADPDSPVAAPPDVFRCADHDPAKPLTRFNLDLRVGMDSGVEAGVRRFVLWDRDAPTNVAWHPGLSRDGAAVPSPQRYRFWVTAVDAFEQESQPRAVFAHDADAGEAASLLFSPRRRGSLLPPPAADVALGTAGRHLRLLPRPQGGFAVTVQWDTPYLSNVGRRDDAQHTPRRADKAELSAALKLFRRRLRRKVEAPLERFSALAGHVSSGTFALPQWRQAIEEITTEGWSECASLDGICPPDEGEGWRHTVEFGHADRGYEYVALLGMVVQPSVAASWLGDTERRTAVRAARTDGSWIARSSRIVETPRSSAVVPTEGWLASTDASTLQPGALPVPNTERPRPARIRCADLLRATPVLPVPGVSRDLLLLRLLGHSVGTNVAEPSTSWADTGIALTSAQSAVLETALQRSVTQSGIEDVVADPRLRIARRLLAAELETAEADPNRYRQHPAVGFRGVAQLRWRYSPFAITPPRMDEAEAEKLRVLCVRVPRDGADAARFATVRGTGRRDGDEWILQDVPVDQADSLDTLERFQHPALVQIDYESGTRYGLLAKLVRNGDVVRIGISGADQDGLNTVTLSLFVAQPIAELSIPSHDDETNETLYLPVGGGRAEVFGYWLQSVSAQERTSGLAATPSCVFEESPTIEPRAPQAFQVDLPPDSTSAFALDPMRDRAFLPSAISTDDLAQHNPRVVLSWSPYDPDEAVGIEIEREERRADAPAPLPRRRALSADPWIAIKAIDALPTHGLIHPNWIETLRATWLLGAKVDVPQSDAGVVRLLVPAAIARRLSGSDGLKTIATPTSPAQRHPAFIDYFRSVNDASSAMDGNYEYRYRVRAWIDVLPGQPPDVEPERRLLRGPATQWSEWALPEPTEATLMPQPGVSLAAQPRDTPSVRLTFRSGAGVARSEGGGWFYRVTVKRKLDFTLRSTETAAVAPRWTEAGSPVEILPGGGVAHIDDLRLERPSVETALRATYQITARQLVRTPDGAERLVRALIDAEVVVDVPPPSDPEGEERLAVKTIEIR